MAKQTSSAQALVNALDHLTAPYQRLLAPIGQGSRTWRAYPFLFNDAIARHEQILQSYVQDGTHLFSIEGMIDMLAAMDMPQAAYAQGKVQEYKAVVDTIAAKFDAVDEQSAARTAAKLRGGDEVNASAASFNKAYTAFLRLDEEQEAVTAKAVSKLIEEDHGHLITAREELALALRMVFEQLAADRCTLPGDDERIFSSQKLNQLGKLIRSMYQQHMTDTALYRSAELFEYTVVGSVATEIPESRIAGVRDSAGQFLQRNVRNKWKSYDLSVEGFLTQLAAMNPQTLSDNEEARLALADARQEAERLLTSLQGIADGSIADEEVIERLNRGDNYLANIKSLLYSANGHDHQIRLDILGDGAGEGFHALSLVRLVDEMVRPYEHDIYNERIGFLHFSPKDAADSALQVGAVGSSGNIGAIRVS